MEAKNKTNDKSTMLTMIPVLMELILAIHEYWSWFRVHSYKKTSNKSANVVIPNGLPKNLLTFCSLTQVILGHCIHCRQVVKALELQLYKTKATSL